MRILFLYTTFRYFIFLYIFMIFHLTSNYHNFLIFFIEVLMIVVSFIIITRVNPMVSLFNLIIFYILIAKYLYLVDLSIIGIFYLLIYVGAISVLFIFILTLIDIKLSEIYSRNSKSNLSIFMIFYIFLFVLVLMYFLNYFDFDYNFIYHLNDFSIFSDSEIKVVGELFYVQFAVIFIVLGFMLLLAIIAAITLLKWI